MRDLEIKLELEALICEREAMLAENSQRHNDGQAMAYHEHDFFCLAKEIRDLIGRMKKATGGETEGEK